MKKKTIKIFAMRCNEFVSYKGRFEDIENTLEAKQNIVGGTIQNIMLPNGVDMICNDDGKIMGLPINRLWIDDGKPSVVAGRKCTISEPLDFLAGNIFFCRHNDEGDYTDILEEDIPYILEHIKALDFFTGKTMFVMKEEDLPEYED